MSRVVAPCVNASRHQWHRTGPVITLGEMFLALGQSYTAKAIYAFYRTCQIVVLKKKKASVKPGAPGTASGARFLSNRGVVGSPLQAAAIRREHLTNADALVRDYVCANRVSAERARAAPKEELFDEAVRFMYKVLMRDLRPPWLDHTFLQALPGDAILSRFTRPSFLFWPEGQTEELFGATVHAKFAQRAEVVDLEFAGIVARPLYMCVETVGPGTGDMCENVASMTEHLRQEGGRAAYRCSACIERLRASGAPGAANAPRRALWAYPAVWSRGDSVSYPTPLRVQSPVRLLVHVPPETWGWQEVSGSPPEASGTAAPTLYGDTGYGTGYHSYTKPESDSIWLRSGPFKAAAPDARGWIS